MEQDSRTFDENLGRNRRSIDWKNLVQKRIPITEWLPRYRLSTFLRDLLAGFTVGLTEVPQGIAYASVAGLPPEYGLYAGFMGCFIYAVFGSCKDINIGPTAIMALMVQPHVEKMGPDAAILITFMSGLIILMLGLMHLGFVVEFFSYPVVAGFTCAAAMQIASSQFKSLFGLKGKANEFLESVIHLIEHITETRKWDAILGFTSIVILMLMRELKNFGGMKYNPQWSKSRNNIGRCLWLLSLSRNALVVIAGTAIAYILKQNGETPFTLIDKVGKGLPPFEPPPFSSDNNGTIYKFDDMIKNYSSSIAFVPLVAILESIAIAKAFSKGKSLDATQELIALGICNIMGSFVSSMPVTGSFTRTAVNNSSGVKTTLGGVITGILVLLALGFLTSTFAYIPKTTLASVVITSMFYLFDFEAIVTIWKSKKLDMIPFLITFLASLFLSLEYGIIIGIGSNLIYVLYPTARPKITVRKQKMSQGDVFVVVPIPNMQFPVAEYFREKILSECGREKATVIIDGSALEYVDTTVAKNIDTLKYELEIRHQNLILLNFPENVVSVCVSIGPKMEGSFRYGNLEDVIDDTNNDRISVDVAFSIQ